MRDTPAFLIQQSPRISIADAEKIVERILKHLGLQVASRRRNQQIITKAPNTPQEKSKKYFELVNQTRETGVCGFLQQDIDQADRVFGGTWGTSTPNWQMTLTTTWAGYQKSLKGPCRSVPSEVELSEDIEFYKEETCIESAHHDFDLCFRNYRGYLFSSIALIDGYINRHILLYDYEGKKGKDFEELKGSRNTERRIELFVNIFCNFSFQELKTSTTWSHFQELKILRNEMVHSVSPYFGISLQEIATNLNLSILGIGEMLKKLQEGQGRASLGFIERVRTSPVVHFNEITLRGDGNHTQKIQRNTVKRT